MAVIITGRVIAGLGMGGIIALVQVIIATIVSPRERGRYSGYIGAVFALGHGQRAARRRRGRRLPAGLARVFYVGVPFAVVAFILLQKTLHLPHVRREVSIDYLGAFLLVAGVSTLLIWVTLGGDSFAWTSLMSYALVAGSVVVLALAIVVEGRSPRSRSSRCGSSGTARWSLATVASFFVGAGMFGATVYLQQYFQTARGMTPTHAGLMSICMVLGLSVPASITGRLISPPDAGSATCLRRHHAADRALPAQHDRRAHQPGPGGRLHGRSRSRRRCHQPEPRPRGAEQPRNRTWVPPARSSRSSGPWAARWASPRSAPCSPTGSRPTRGRRRVRRPPEPRRPDLRAVRAGARAVRGARSARRPATSSWCRAVRLDRAGLRAVHPGGPAADDDPARPRWRPAVVDRRADNAVGSK